MLKNSIYTFLLSCLVVLSFAQPRTMVTYETKLDIADESARNHDYYSAIEWFNEAYKESKDLNLQVAMADLFSLARDYERAQKIYERLLRRDRMNEWQDLNYDLGRMFKYQGKYRDALNAFNTVIENPEMDDSIKMLAQKELAGILEMNTMNDNLEAVIKYLPGKVNSGSAESSPAFGPDGQLYFSSFNRKREIILDGEESDYHAKIYAAERNDKGEYATVKPLNDRINREGFNSGGVSFSRDGRRMYFTRAKLNNNAVELSRILVSNATDKGWSAAEELPNVNGEFVSKHPFEGELFGRKVLYFSSDMDGGEGGFDLYYADIDGDNIGIPVNLGPTINTPGDEISPFYMNGTLYYSSNGLTNIGGFDIFYSAWSGSSWEVPVNMGHNYNTSYDDMFLRFNSSGTQGFLVSNRPDKDKLKIKGNETCCDDIYSVQIKELVIDLAALVENPDGPLKGATIELYDLTLGSYPDSKTNFDGNSFNFQLDADRKYKAIITHESHYPDSVSFNTVGIIDDYSIKKTITLKPKPKEADIEVISINQPIRLNNIYYDFDKAEILPDAEKDLEVLLDLLFEYPDMKIELSSHTDARGDAPYNQRLSQRRAESARNWLIEEGVEADRVRPVGYGESVILNRCTDGVRCSDEEHRLNRRTEFKIIEGPTSIEIKKERLKNTSDEKKK